MAPRQKCLRRVKRSSADPAHGCQPPHPHPIPPLLGVLLPWMPVLSGSWTRTRWSWVSGWGRRRGTGGPGGCRRLGLWGQPTEDVAPEVAAPQAWALVWGTSGSPKGWKRFPSEVRNSPCLLLGGHSSQMSSLDFVCVHRGTHPHVHVGSTRRGHRPWQSPGSARRKSAAGPAQVASGHVGLHPLVLGGGFPIALPRAHLTPLCMYFSFHFGKEGKHL